MQICIEMPPVSKCEVSECAYNVNAACHARAITVGDGTHPHCDTYIGSAGHIKGSQSNAGVGACKITQCVHNNDLECAADGINVGYQGTMVHCLTFKNRI